MFTIRGVPYDQKVTRSRKKVNQVFKFFFQTRVKNGTRKCVVDVVSSQVVLSDTVHCTPPSGQYIHLWFKQAQPKMCHCHSPKVEDGIEK